jgi:hypothetical protein
MAKVSQLARDTNVFDARGETDTIRLWENYRDQALLWRAIALIQIPTSLLLAIFALVMWSTRSVTLNVPAKPLPGMYLAREIPDTEFVEVATDFINLIASYQPSNARRQFNHARQMLVEPMLTRFQTEMMGIELKAIEQTTRTQLFYPDPTRTTFERIDDKSVKVSFVGDRLKLVAGQEVPAELTRFTVVLTTIPRQQLNPYGIVITNVQFENLSRDRSRKERS